MVSGLAAVDEREKIDVEIPCIVESFLRVAAARGTVHGDSEENTGAT